MSVRIGGKTVIVQSCATTTNDDMKTRTENDYLKNQQLGTLTKQSNGSNVRVVEGNHFKPANGETFDLNNEWITVIGRKKNKYNKKVGLVRK